MIIYEQEAISIDVQSIKAGNVFSEQLLADPSVKECLSVPTVDELYQAYARELYAYLLRRLKSHESAEDLLQETFLRAWKALPKLQTPLNARPWLYRIATNLAIDASRHQQLLTWQSLDADGYDHPGEEDIEERTCATELVEIALQEIPTGYRKALVLYAREGYSYSQVAQEVGIAQSGAKMYISRARSRFRERYAAGCSG